MFWDINFRMIAGIVSLFLIVLWISSFIHISLFKLLLIISFMYLAAYFVEKKRNNREDFVLKELKLHIYPVPKTYALRVSERKDFDIPLLNIIKEEIEHRIFSWKTFIYIVISGFLFTMILHILFTISGFNQNIIPILTLIFVLSFFLFYLIPNYANNVIKEKSEDIKKLYISQIHKT
jgi:hypothetical protein